MTPLKSMSFKMLEMQLLDVNPSDVAFLETMILDARGQIYPFAAHFYHKYVKPDVLRVWCAKRARYTVVTRELLDWLRNQIAGKPALEIGAGMGDLGFHLGIPMTDNYGQTENQEVAAFMSAMKQTPTTPPKNLVVKADAQTAVMRFKPSVVIGSWITQRWLPGDTEGNAHGPREEEIIKNCETYIHIGNEHIHGKKRILKLPHETYKFHWLVSRAADQTQNVIHVWHNKDRY
jgi:hypothetical protein